MRLFSRAARRTPWRPQPYALPTPLRSPFCTTPPRPAKREIPFSHPAGLKPRANNPHGKIQLPSDMGLLPDTFITPTLRSGPNPLRHPVLFLRVRWLGIKSRLKDRVSLLAQKWSSPARDRWWRRRMRIARGDIPAMAARKHALMYRLFAAGDSDAAIDQLCCSGLAGTLKSRIAARRRGEVVTWECVRYHTRPRVVSDRVVSTMLEGCTVRQAVVKINTRQRLTRTVDGEVVQGSGREKDVVEYLVVQAIYQYGKVGKWMVWGAAEESTLEGFEQARKDNLQVQRSRVLEEVERGPRAWMERPGRT